MQFRWMYSQESELKKIQFTRRQGLRGILRRYSRVKILQTSQACISHMPTM
jgi:hypothetical protein